MYSLECYDNAFYDTYGNEAKQMAPWFMPLLNEVIPFKSLVDVGCGDNHYTQFLKQNGWDGNHLLGIEGSPSACARTDVFEHDLRTPLTDVREFDIALSLEVAEHIELEYADVFVNNLCALSDVIVMTAAPPGQGGLQHVNEQDAEYWKRLFWDRHYRPDHNACLALKAGICKAQDLGKYCAPWLLPNLMVFRRV